MNDLERYEMLIDGTWIRASDGGCFESVDPATGFAWATIPEATADDVDRAVRAADRAMYKGPWSTMTPTERGRCLRKLGDLMAAASGDLGRVETRDTGKMFKETRWQSLYIAEYYQFYAGFGPVLSVLRFKTEDEVPGMAHDTCRGLFAGIFTKASARALRMSKRIRAGIVWVNTYRAISPIAAFGGVKTSGYGREAGLQAVYDYTRPKTVWMNMSDAPLANPFQPR